MRKFVAFCMMGLVVASASLVNAADLKSGLQVDEHPAAFNVTDITGPSAGEKLCYRCQYGARPVVSIFVRKMDENTAKLVKELDAVVSKNAEDKKMAAFVTVLSDDPDAQEAALKKFAEDQKIKRTPLTVFENAVGPAMYKINEKASVTVMMWVDSNVEVNYAFADGELNADAIAKVVKDTEKILN
jgi:hypothetical protein